ncbi:uncharacterized protein LOC101855494 [Aplysia californica]|uniref:Uncharacterized protein LOC101855494 n=1 Tax=Aplysia californica TaxID=6500 RepID=A0ABM0JQM0_APLCA|nr:uncharacterized protein LOC101855494 [Aplysia californica]
MDKRRPPQSAQQSCNNNDNKNNDPVSKANDDNDKNDDDDGYDSTTVSADAKKIPKRNDRNSSNSSNSSNGYSDGANTRNQQEGGYGWVIVIASFFNAFIIDGTGSCFGLLFPYIVEKYESSAFVASFAGSLFVALMIMGTVSAELVRRFGFRSVSMLGGVLSCVAFVASVFSPNIIVFILTYGLMAGCSCGLVFVPSIVIVNGYFHEKRGLANGIITSGSGAGLLCLAPFINFLLERYHLEGTVLILAGILLNMCVFSSLYRPPSLGTSHKTGEQGGRKDGCWSEQRELQSHSKEGSNRWFGDEGVESWETDFADICEISLTASNESLPYAQSKTSVDGSKYDDRPAQESSIHEKKPKSALQYLQYRLFAKSRSDHASLFPHLQFGSQKKLERTGKGTERVQWKSAHQLQGDDHLQPSSNPQVSDRLHRSAHNLPTWTTDKEHDSAPRGKQQYLLSTNHGTSEHSHHHSHRPHSQSHLLPPDHGSNLYLAGSISTLKSLHNKHLHSLHASQSSALHVDHHHHSSSRIPKDNCDDEQPSDLLVLGNSTTENSLHLPPKLKTSHNYIHNTHSPFQSVSNVSAKDHSIGALPNGKPNESVLQEHLLNNSDKHAPQNKSQQIMPPILILSPTGHQGSNSYLNIPSYHKSTENVDIIETCPAFPDVDESLPFSGYTTRQLLSMPAFHIFCFGASLIQFGYPIAGTFLADYAYQYGLSSSHTAILMVLLGSSNIFGRLLAGSLANLGLDPLRLNNMSLVLGGLACLLSPLYTQFWSLCVLASLFGFFLGFFPPLQPLILVEYFGLDSLVSAFGFLTTIKGLANIVGAPIAGRIYDASGNYAYSFVFAGACFLTSALVHWLMTLARPQLSIRDR